jgi:hypothetical protein
LIGDICTSAEFCYDGGCNSNAKGIPKFLLSFCIFLFFSLPEIVVLAILLQLEKIVIVLTIFAQVLNFVMMGFAIPMPKKVNFEFFASYHIFCFIGRIGYIVLLCKLRNPRENLRFQKCFDTGLGGLSLRFAMYVFELVVLAIQS